MTARKTCAACRDGSELPFDFIMALQPIVDAAAARVWGYEALVRGVNGEPAGTVLAQVDETNRYRFDQACRVKAIETAGRLFDAPELRLSINFMPNAVYEPAACIRASLEAAARVGFSHDRILFEFTENEQMPDIGHVKRIIEAYRDFGFITAIDDFGSGYSGLGLLAEFQPDLIKIDMHLLRGVHRDPARQAIIAGVVGIARSLDVTVLAEGVEEHDEYLMLRAAGISLFQGYFFGRPAIGALPPVRMPEGVVRPAVVPAIEQRGAIG